MTVLSLSPDCVYEHEAARVQWSSSLVYASALQPHGQWRVARLMGLGAILLMRERCWDTQRGHLLFEEEEMRFFLGTETHTRGPIVGKQPERESARHSTAVLV